MNNQGKHTLIPNILAEVTQRKIRCKAQNYLLFVNCKLFQFSLVETKKNRTAFTEYLFELQKLKLDSYVTKLWSPQ